MIGLLNIGSLVLGLIAWILPVVNLMRNEKHRNWIALSMISMSACSISLFFQIININYLVKVERVYAIMDTSGAIVYASAALILVTIILNATTFIVYRGRTVK